MNDRRSLYTGSINNMLPTENSQTGMSTVIMAPTGAHAINTTDQKVDDELTNDKQQILNEPATGKPELDKERNKLQSQNGPVSSQGGLSDKQPPKIKRILIATKKTNIEFMTPRLNSQREMYRTSHEDNFLGGSSQGSILLNQDNLYLASIQKKKVLNQFDLKNKIFSTTMQNNLSSVKIPSLSNVESQHGSRMNP